MNFHLADEAEKHVTMKLYVYPMVFGLSIAIFGRLIRACTIRLRDIVRGGRNKEVYATDLVTDGLFHLCRNPLYIGNILMLLGVAFLSTSLVFILIAVPFFGFIYQAIVLAEENYLKTKFGKAYEAYCKNVNRWIPKLKEVRETFGSMKFNWNRYMVNECNTVYLLLVSIFIVLITHHPNLTRLSADQKIEISTIVFLSLSAIYLFVRYLKKSKKLITI